MLVYNRCRYFEHPALVFRKSRVLAGARYAANNINHILEEASQATQTAVNIAGKECDLEEQYQLGTEAALKPHLRTIIILKQGTVWCTSLPGNRVLLSRIPVFPDSNLLLAPAIDTVNRLPILLYQSQFADTRILVTISDQHIRGALNVPLKGVRYVLRVADDIIGPTGDVMTLNGHYPYTEKVHSKNIISLLSLTRRHSLASTDLSIKALGF